MPPAQPPRPNRPTSSASPSGGSGNVGKSAAAAPAAPGSAKPSRGAAPAGAGSSKKPGTGGIELPQIADLSPIDTSHKTFKMSMGMTVGIGVVVLAGILVIIGAVSSMKQQNIEGPQAKPERTKGSSSRTANSPNGTMPTMKFQPKTPSAQGTSLLDANGSVRADKKQVGIIDEDGKLVFLDPKDPRVAAAKEKAALNQSPEAQASAMKGEGQARTTGAGAEIPDVTPSAQ